MLEIKKKKGKMLIAASQLKPNPKNAHLYNNKEKELNKQKEIAETYRIRISEGKIPNIQPILIHKDGLIDAGHTRYEAAKIVELQLGKY
jgi:hypothetical protein